MTNKMNRDSNGLFTNKNENETTGGLHSIDCPLVTTTLKWQGYTDRSHYADALFDATVKDAAEVRVGQVGGTIPLVNAMKLQHEATMSAAREARVANMIAIATHKEYFNKETVSTAYNEIQDYIYATSYARAEAIVDKVLGKDWI